MKTYFEITGNKTYRQLTTTEKEAIQNRQTQLAVQWQEETSELSKLEIFDELHASFTGLVKGMAYRKAQESFSVEQEDFEGIMYLVLVETLTGSNDEMQVEMYGQRLITFDPTMNKPFQPIFITNIRNVLKMMYRAKGYDIHETTLHEANRLDSPSPSDPFVTLGDALETERPFTVDVEQMVSTEKIMTDLFGSDDRKKTIVHMTIQGFKRNEIVSAVQETGKSTDAVAKQVNRTVKQFKDYYLNLMQSN